MLVHFDPTRIYLHNGGSICLFHPDPFYRYFRSGWIDLLVPPDRFRRDRIHATSAVVLYGQAEGTRRRGRQQKKWMDIG